MILEEQKKRSARIPGKCSGARKDRNPLPNVLRLKNSGKDPTSDRAMYVHVGVCKEPS